MKVVIIGSGNVATVFGHRIKKSGNTILQIVSRSPQNADALASELKATASCSILDINTEADIYIVAVSDQAVQSVSGELRVGDKLVVHTAASVSREVLKNSSNKYGVLYPLQSLRK